MRAIRTSKSYSRLRAGLLFTCWMLGCAHADRPPVASAPRPQPRVVGDCPTATDVVDGLPFPIKVRVVASPNNPGVAAVVRQLEAELAPYRAAARGRLEVAVLDAEDPDVRAQAEDAGLEALPIDGKRAWSGYIVDHGRTRQKNVWIDPSSIDVLGLGLHLRLRMVRELAGGTRHRIGVLVGHGEPRLDDDTLTPPKLLGESLAQLVARELGQYRFVDVDLRARPEIDPTLDALIVLQPTQDLKDEELHAIDSFVMRGRRLVVAASAVDPGAGATPTRARLEAHGLDRLLRGYGIELGRDVVADPAGTFLRDRSGDSEDGKTLAPAVLQLIQPARAGAFPLWQQEEVAFPYASTLTVQGNEQPDAKPRVLMTTPPRALRVTTSPVDLSPGDHWKTGTPVGEVPLVVALEGTLKSAFDERRSAGRAGVLAIASAAAFRNPFVSAGGGGAPPRSPEARDELADRYARSPGMGAQLRMFRNALLWTSLDPQLLACLHDLPVASR